MERLPIVKKNSSDTPPSHVEVIGDYLSRRWSFRYNQITSAVEVSETEVWEELTDRKENSIILAATQDGIKDASRLIRMLIRSEWVEPFDPIKSYFETRKWDKADHIGALARTISVRERSQGLETKWWPRFLRRWLIGVVACALDHRFQNQLCLILAGAQGRGKTTWLERLIPDELSPYSYIGHISPSLSDKNTASYLSEKLIINVDDQFETLFSKDFNQMKGVITTTTTTIRKPYERSYIKRPRIASFCGSVNSPQFLYDEENRRYLCFETEAIHYLHGVDMDQVWAQAFVAWFNGEQGYLTPEEKEAQRILNQSFQSQTSEMDWLRKLFIPAGVDDPGVEWLQMGEILTTLQDHSRLKLSPKRLKTALSICGFAEPVSKREDRFKTPRYLIPVHRRTKADEIS